MGITQVRLDRTENIRQRLMRDTVAAYKRKYPKFYRQCGESVKEMRGTRATVYGSDKELELRMCLRLPDGLYTALDTILKDPAVFNEKKELQWFMRTFPEFCVPAKI